MFLTADIPAAVTPWLVLITTFIGALAAIGTAFFWLRNKAARAFTEAVIEAARPLLVQFEESLRTERAVVEDKLHTRSVDVDAKFDALERKLGAIEARISKTNETVATKIPDPPNGTNGGA